MEHIVHRDGDQLFTTSEIIAERAEVEHRAILQLIGKYHNDLAKFGQLAFEMRPGYNNAQVRIAKLNEQQSTLLLTFLKNTAVVRQFKVDLVTGFFEMAQHIQELEQQTQQPAELSRREILTMALEAEERADQYEQQLEIAAPKVEYHDTFVAEHDEMTIRTLSASLKIGEKALRELLIAAEWIYREESERWSDSQQRKVKQFRYSAYSHKKQYFIPRHEHKAPRFRGEVMHYLKVTPAGANAVDRLLQRVIKEYGDSYTGIRALEAQRQERISQRKEIA